MIDINSTGVDKEIYTSLSCMQYRHYYTVVHVIKDLSI